jgi:alkylated DNA repair protein (DNA oxidative demethylase)
MIAGMRVDVLPGSVLLRDFVDAAAIAPVLRAVLDAAPLRRMSVSSGAPMSVTQTNCGDVGWIADARGYRYVDRDPLTGEPWPAIPPALRAIAVEAACAAGFAHFDPDACLVNRYEPGARMGLHQDRDEAQIAAHPIVTLSFGLPARFFIRAESRTRGPIVTVPLDDGDAFVMGGATRLAYHGIRPVAAGTHPVWGAARLSWTFRRAR